LVVALAVDLLVVAEVLEDFVKVLLKLTLVQLIM
jgi:hypothetical protein